MCRMVYHVITLTQEPQDQVRYEISFEHGHCYTWHLVIEMIAHTLFHHLISWLLQLTDHFLQMTEKKVTKIWITNPTIKE
jgi:hypothetical protein